MTKRGVIVSDEARVFSAPAEDSDLEFVGAFGLTFEIEKSKREAHDLKFKMLDTIFQKSKQPLRVNLTWKIITLIYDAISAAEEISDFLRGLVIKYPSR